MKTRTGGSPSSRSVLDTETVFVDLTKDEIKKAPEFDEKTYWGEAYKSDLGDYYSRRTMR